jgi:hypothetical protein
MMIISWVGFFIIYLTYYPTMTGYQRADSIYLLLLIGNRCEYKLIVTYYEGFNHYPYDSMDTTTKQKCIHYTIQFLFITRLMIFGFLYLSEITYDSNIANYYFCSIVDATIHCLYTKYKTGYYYEPRDRQDYRRETWIQVWVIIITSLILWWINGPDLILAIIRLYKTAMLISIGTGILRFTGRFLHYLWVGAENFPCDGPYDIPGPLLPVWIIIGLGLYYYMTRIHP